VPIFIDRGALRYKTANNRVVFNDGFWREANDAKGLAARIGTAEEPGGVSQTCAKRQTFLDAAVVASRVEAAHLLSRASQ
jgi:hypothetical protein